MNLEKATVHIVSAVCIHFNFQLESENEIIRDHRSEKSSHLSRTVKETFHTTGRPFCVADYQKKGANWLQAPKPSGGNKAASEGKVNNVSGSTGMQQTYTTPRRSSSYPVLQMGRARSCSTVPGRLTDSSFFQPSQRTTGLQGSLLRIINRTKLETNNNHRDDLLVTNKKMKKLLNICFRILEF